MRESLSEIDTQLTLAEDLGYIEQQEGLRHEVVALACRINRLIAHVRSPKH